MWTTCLLLLLLEFLLDLKTNQVDINAEFMHAHMKEYDNVYVEMPISFIRRVKVPNPNKALYGLCKSARAFWKFRTKNMK